MADKDAPTNPADMMHAAFEPFRAEMERMQAQMSDMMEAMWSGRARVGAGAMREEFSRMQNRTSQMMENMLSGAFPGAALPPGANLPAMRPAQPMAANAFAAMTGLPPTDVFETDEAFTITAELPGLTTADVDVSVTDAVLTLSGEKTGESSSDGANYYASERRYGRFQRAFPLPPSVDRDAISASFDNGVLTLTLPKKDGATGGGRKVTISG